MSSALVGRIGAIAAETAVGAAWAQWASLTAAAVPVGQPVSGTIIDPEALILASLALRDRERRLDDLLAGWARSSAFLVSVQRLKTLARRYPPGVEEQLADFARYAMQGGDRRWRAAAKGVSVRAVPREKETGPIRLIQGPTLMLRLRAGLGVGAKADVLAFLLGIGDAADLRTMSEATAYTTRAVRTAASDMALARFIHAIEGPRTTYRVDAAAWAGVLDVPTPPWHFWSVAFELLTAVMAWSREAELADWSAYVASSRARDLMEERRKRLRYLDIPLPRKDDAHGAEYLDVFERYLNDVARWTHDALRGGNGPG